MLATLDPNSSVSPAALAQPLALSPAAAPHVAQARNLHDLLGRLMGAKLGLDATRVVLRAVPQRYAVAWVYECYKQDAERLAFAAPELECLQCVERWIADGSEANRQTAADAASAAKHESGASWLAAAAGWSGGSLAPRGYTVVPPAEHLTADGCFAALCLLAAREPAAFAARLQAWVERAIRVFGRAGGAATADAAARGPR